MSLSPSAIPDLLLNADDGYLPPRFTSEVIFDDGFLCVANKESKHTPTLTIKQYLAAEHVGIGIWGEQQTLRDKRLAGIGAKRRCPIWVPYFTGAVRCVPGTHLRHGPEQHCKIRIEQFVRETSETTGGDGKA